MLNVLREIVNYLLREKENANYATKHFLASKNATLFYFGCLIFNAKKHFLASKIDRAINSLEVYFQDKIIISFDLLNY